MKANELMEGIYVYFNCFDGSKIIVKVTGFKDGVVYGVSKTGSHWCTIEKVEPIPITPEILEKIGFRLIDDSYYYSDGDNVVLTKNYGNYPGEHKFDWVKHTKGINKRGQYANIDYYIATIDYVHQLQHALKLCGIEKEIVL